MIRCATLQPRSKYVPRYPGRYFPHVCTVHSLILVTIRSIILCRENTGCISSVVRRVGSKQSRYSRAEESNSNSTYIIIMQLSFLLLSFFPSFFLSFYSFRDFACLPVTSREDPCNTQRYVGTVPITHHPHPF